MVTVVRRYAKVAPRHEYGAGFALPDEGTGYLFGDPVREEIGAVRRGRTIVML